MSASVLYGTVLIVLRGWMGRLNSGVVYCKAAVVYLTSVTMMLPSCSYSSLSLLVVGRRPDHFNCISSYLAIAIHLYN